MPLAFASKLRRNRFWKFFMMFPAEMHGCVSSPIVPVMPESG